MGPKESGDFIAEEQKGWVPGLRWFYTRGIELVPAYKNSLEKSRGAFRKQGEPGERDEDFLGLMNSEGGRAVEM